jgi:hypothetical protein
MKQQIEDLSKYLKSPEYYLEMMLTRFSQQDFSDNYYTFEPPTYSEGAPNPLYGIQEERKTVWSHIDPETGEVCFKERSLKSFIQTIFPDYGIRVNHKYDFKKIKDPNRIKDPESDRVPTSFKIDETLRNVEFVINKIYQEIDSAKVSPALLEYASFVLESILLYMNECCSLTKEQRTQIDSLFSQLVPTEI